MLFFTISIQKIMNLKAISLLIEICIKKKIKINLILKWIKNFHFFYNFKVYNSTNDLKVEILTLAILFLFISSVRIITGIIGLFVTFK